MATYSFAFFGGLYSLFILGSYFNAFLLKVSDFLSELHFVTFLLSFELFDLYTELCDDFIRDFALVGVLEDLIPLLDTVIDVSDPVVLNSAELV